MPTSLKRIVATGGHVFLHRCDVAGCGADAPFGYGVEMRRAQVRLDAGDPAGAKRFLGKWYCREHRPPGRDAGA